MIIFTDSKENYYLRNYHPLWIQRQRNPNFDEWSQKLLELKRKEKDAVIFWYYQLEKYLRNEFFAIAVVPSSSSKNKTSGIHLVAQKIVEARQINIIDATDCLSRYRSIDKLASGGSRELTIHTNSIEVLNPHMIKDKNVILIDDISTSGNSLRACQELLLQAGASRVKCVALGKTVLYHLEDDMEAFTESAHEEIEIAVARVHAEIAMNAECQHEQLEEDAANAHTQIAMNAECEHEQVEENAAKTHAQIDMYAECQHEQAEEDVANAYCSIDMVAEYEHEQVEKNAANAHAQIDINAEYEHEQIEESAVNAHYSIEMAAEHEHEQVDEDALYAHTQVDIGADYVHLELKFLSIQ